MKENTSRNTKNIDSLLGAVQVKSSLRTYLIPVSLNFSPVSAGTNPACVQVGKALGAARCSSVYECGSVPEGPQSRVRCETLGELLHYR